MRPALRPPEPELLSRHRVAMTQEYVSRKAADPNHGFRWPRREGMSLHSVVIQALVAMTDRRCAYCDGNDISGTGVEHIDHFRPKSRTEFHPLVCEWTNLYFVCCACNQAKLEKWDDGLLAPDQPGFTFERFFVYNARTGRLEPNGDPAATPDAKRAETTIAILNLNRDGACRRRMEAVRTIKWLMSDNEPDEAGRIFENDSGYRYLVRFYLQ